MAGDVDSERDPAEVEALGDHLTASLGRPAVQYPREEVGNSGAVGWIVERPGVQRRADGHGRRRGRVRRHDAGAAR